MTDLMRGGSFTPADQAQVRQAATLVLVRDADDGMEVFMMRRPDNIDFGGLYVFPGGKLDAGDRDPRLAELAVGLDDVQAHLHRAHVSDGLAYWMTALRECFEECGVLLAYQDEALFDHASLSDAALMQLRKEVKAGTLTMAALCQQLGVRPALDHVHYFSHWLTPEGPPRRYDTRFFLALAPAGQDGLHDDHELIDSLWLSPRDALSRQRRGEINFIYPTRTTLESLARFDTTTALLAAVRAQTHLPEYTETLRREGMQPYVS